MALIVNCFFTDNEFSFIERPSGSSMKKIKYSSITIDSGIIENGIIFKKDKLLDIVEKTFATFKIKATKVNLVLHEELFTFRKVVVPAVYKESEIRDYILSQIGTKGQSNSSINIPFDDMLIDFVIHNKTPEYYDVIMFYSPEQEVKQYIDIFTDMGMSVIASDIPPLSLHRLYYYKRFEDPNVVFEKDIMFVSVFRDTYSMYIFDQEIPMFSLVQTSNVDYEDPEQYLISVDNEISRIMNYYKFNLNNGERNIKKLVVFNMTKFVSNEEFNTFFVGDDTDELTIEDEYECVTQVFDMKKISKIVDAIIDRECYVAFSASLAGTGGK